MIEGAGVDARGDLAREMGLGITPDCAHECPSCESRRVTPLGGRAPVRTCDACGSRWGGWGLIEELEER